jgi:hypothetical protein
MADEGDHSGGGDRGLDYETPPPRPEPKSGFWAALIGGWIVGVVAANVLADVLKMRLTGHHADLGTTCLASFTILPAALLAALLPARHRSPGVAAGVGILAPPVAVVVMYLPMALR